MMNVKDFLNKIKWSGKFKPEELTVYYLDRIKNKLIEIDYKDLKIEGDFIILEDTQIPLHRIKEIRRKGEIIWKR